MIFEINQLWVTPFSEKLKFYSASEPHSLKTILKTEVKFCKMELSHFLNSPKARKKEQICNSFEFSSSNQYVVQQKEQDTLWDYVAFTDLRSLHAFKKTLQIRLPANTHTGFVVGFQTEKERLVTEHGEQKMVQTAEGEARMTFSQSWLKEMASWKRECACRHDLKQTPQEAHGDYNLDLIETWTMQTDSSKNGVSKNLFLKNQDYLNFHLWKKKMTNRQNSDCCLKVVSLL